VILSSSYESFGVLPNVEANVVELVAGRQRRCHEVVGALDSVVDGGVFNRLE